MATLKCLTVVLVLALAAPALAVHLDPPGPMQTCWTDGVWGTYVTYFAPEWNPNLLRVVGYQVYPDGSFTTPLVGGGFRRPDGTVTVTLSYYSHGNEFKTVVNFYHHLQGGTAHLYYDDGYHPHYDIHPIAPAPCLAPADD